MRYADIKPNDIVDGKGITVSVWFQGCDVRCKGCHNQQTWDFNGGKEIETQELINKVIYLLDKNNVNRNLSILGGEPLCKQNRKDCRELIEQVRQKTKNKIIYLWTGHVIEDLAREEDKDIDYILKNIDVLIDGPYIEKQRDLNLELRGSRNQRVIYRKGVIDLYESKSKQY